MDKKMRKLVTKPIRKAEKTLKNAEKGSDKKTVGKAEKILKKAEKSNVRLANYDEKVRDPMIDKYKKMKKKGC
jgi:hypothetical protein